MEIDAATLQLGEVTFDGPKCSVEFHPNRDQAVAGNQPGIPDLAMAIGVLVMVRIDNDILAHDVADLRGTSEVLVAVG